ncbi:hypothetical protein [Parapedobacter tibetensis]|uniref:hypothetical protein n=1 Tax=Parapedobacter tibetensis TaxID=2972951 RepID=UPI00214DE079|nr:hypothetical protein [Parapedobacter tibetensis]
MNFPSAHQKYELIRQHLLPLLDTLPAALHDRFCGGLAERCQLRQAVARQYVEEPGTADEGHAILLLQSVAHSFQIIDQGPAIRYIGTQIWRRRTLIFNPAALHDGEARTDYVQALEPSPYLSIRYPALHRFMADYAVIERAITVLARQQERQRQAHDHLLRLTPLQRVATFEKRYPTFAHVATVETRCMHAGLSRQTYSKKLKLLAVDVKS